MQEQVRQIITIYCLCDAFLQAWGQQDAPQAKMTTAQVMTVSLAAITLLHGNQAARPAQNHSQPHRQRLSTQCGHLAGRKSHLGKSENMSHILVLAAVTAVLKNLLENGLVDRGITAALGSDTTISALPPDRITTGSDEKTQLNLFLYQVNSKGLSPMSRHAQASDEVVGQGLSRSVEMQYLLTAYGMDDLQTEILLGYGMQLFQETQVLNANALRKLLNAVSARSGGHLVSASRAALADPLLPQSFQRIKICPQALQTEEMVNLWSAFQVSYRPSVAYLVSVELAGDASAAEKGR